MRVTRRALGELLLVSLASIHVAKAEVVVFGSFSHPPPLTPQQQQDDGGPIQGHIDSARHACAVDVALHCNAGPADDFVDQFFGSSDPFMNLFGGGPMMMMPAGLTMTMEREETNDPFGRRIEQNSNVMRQNHQEANNDPIGTLLDEMMDTAIRMHSDPVAAVSPPTIVVEGSWSSSPSALDDLDMLFDSMLNGLFERVASASNSASADGAAEEKEEEAPRREEEETSEGSAQQPFSMSGWDPKLFSKRVVEHGKAVLEQAKGATNEEEVVSEEQQPELRNRLARRLTEVTDEVFFPLEDGSILVVAAAPSQTTEEEREAEEQARLPSLGFGCGGDRCLWTLHDTAETFGHRPILSGGCRDALGNVKHSLRRLRQPMEQQPQHHNLMTWSQLEQEQLEENVNQARRERLESILTFEVAVVLLTLSALLLLRLVLFLHRRNSHGHLRGGGRFGRMSEKRRLKRRIMQAVYSNPTLKAQVEDAVGEELGNLPPLAPRALRFVGSSSAGSERGGCLSCFHVLCHSLPLFSLMGLLCITSVTNPDAVILIGGPALVLLGLYKCCVCFFCARQDYSNDDVECKCCCCGTSTSDVTPDTVNKCTCNCCHGTGVCSPSCKSCCEGGGDDDDAIVTSANTNTDEEDGCCKCCCCGTSASDVATGGMVGDCNCQCCHGSGVCSTDCASCGGRNGGYVSVSSSGNIGPAMAGYPGARRSVINNNKRNGTGAATNEAAYVGVPVQVV